MQCDVFKFLFWNMARHYGTLIIPSGRRSLTIGEGVPTFLGFYIHYSMFIRFLYTCVTKEV